MAKRKMTRADVEEEIRRTRGLDSLRDPIPEGGAYPVEDDYPNLKDADLSGEDLSDLDLELASLEGADLRKAILSGTKLPSANLDRADLTGTTRTDGADLTGATLYFARLGGADLSRAILRPEDSDDTSARRPTIPDFLKNATYNEATRWPKGFDPKQYGALKAEPSD